MSIYNFPPRTIVLGECKNPFQSLIKNNSGIFIFEGKAYKVEEDEYAFNLYDKEGNHASNEICIRILQYAKEQENK